MERGSARVGIVLCLAFLCLVALSFPPAPGSAQAIERPAALPGRAVCLGPHAGQRPTSGCTPLPYDPVQVRGLSERTGATLRSSNE